ncbi:MAG: ABC transporter substrate-binding protein [Acidimicrobiia bacterium]
MRWLGAVVALAAAVACGDDGGDEAASDPAVGEQEGDQGTTPSAEPLKVTFGCTQAWSGLPRAVAQATGIDAEHALEIDCTQVSSGPEQTAALLSGDIDAAQGLPANLYPLLDAGESMAAFMLFQDVESYDLVIAADYPLPHEDEGWEGVLEDLRGATIGVPALGGAIQDLAVGMFTEAGLPADHATFVATGTGPTSLPALTNGQIQAAMMSEPHITLALDQGVAVQPFSLMERTGPPRMDWASMMLYTSAATAAERPEHLCRLRSVYEDAIEFTRDPANADEVTGIIAEFMNIEPDVAADVLERNVAYYPRTFDVAGSRIDPAFAFFHEIGKAKAVHTADEIAVEVCG